MTPSRLVAVLLAVSTVTTSVAAQPRPAAAPGDAKQHFDAGIKLYHEGLVREALAEFLQANKLQPRLSVLRNIGQCHRDLHAFGSAYGAYSDMLRLYGSTMRAAEVADVKRALGELAVLTGVVRITSNEAAATVEIDGKQVGKTPLADPPPRLNIGTHAVVVSKEGFDPFSKQVEIQGGDEVAVDASIHKEVLTGHLAVRASAGVSVRLKVDGADVGSLPWEGDLQPGSHLLEVAGKDVAAPPRRVDVTKGAKLDLVIDVEKQVGRVQVDPHVADAQISLDGKVVGKGVWEGDVAPGQHELTIEAPGFVTLKRALLVHAGERRVESIALVAATIDKPTDYRGVYADLSGLFLLSPNPFEKCSSETCQSGGPAFGPGAFVNVGYSFGIVGVEGIGLVDVDFTKVGIGSKPDPIQRVVVGGGLGARVLSKSPTTRATFGAGFVLAHEEGQVTVSSPSTLNLGASGELACVVFDGGLLLGSTPGAKFKLGIAATIDTALKDITTKANQGNTFTIAHGTEVLVGPQFGVQFGY